LGEELIEQKKIIAHADGQVLKLRSENFALKKKVAELTGDTLPQEFFESQIQSPVKVSSSNSNQKEDDAYLLPVFKGGMDDDIKYTNRLDEEESLNY